MAERDFWAYLKERWETEGVPGRARRVEERGRKGFSDLLCTFSDLSTSDFAPTYFIELKWVGEKFEKAVPRKAPYGLDGAQAVELDAWARGGAAAFLAVCFGDVSRGGMEADTRIAFWWGTHCLDFFREGSEVVAPDPVLAYRGEFSWLQFRRDSMRLIVRGMDRGGRCRFLITR